MEKVNPILNLRIIIISKGYQYYHLLFFSSRHFLPEYCSSIRKFDRIIVSQLLPFLEFILNTKKTVLYSQILFEGF